MYSALVLTAVGKGFGKAKDLISPAESIGLQKVQSPDECSETLTDVIGCIRWRSVPVDYALVFKMLDDFLVHAIDTSQAASTGIKRTSDRDNYLVDILHVHHRFTM